MGQIQDQALLPADEEDVAAGEGLEQLAVEGVVQERRLAGLLGLDPHAEERIGGGPPQGLQQAVQIRRVRRLPRQQLVDDPVHALVLLQVLPPQQGDGPLGQELGQQKVLPAEIPDLPDHQ